MKKIIFISLICLLLTGFNTQLTGQNLTRQQKSIIEKQVDSLFHTMVKAGENFDYNKLSKGVSDRYNAGFIVNNSYFSSYDSLISILKANLQIGTKQSISIQNKKITVMSDNIVLLTASGDSYVKLSSGQSFNVKFLWSFVYERINNEWKVVQSHQSSAN